MTKITHFFHATMDFGKNVLLKSVTQIRVLRPTGDDGIYYSLKKRERQDYQAFL